MVARAVKKGQAEIRGPEEECGKESEDTIVDRATR